MAKPTDHEDYIRTFPETTQELLWEMNSIIKSTVPGSVEVISYSMPAFKFEGKMLAWFAGYAHHIGFYPGASPIEAFQKDLSGYKNAKGSVQFPLDKPLPEDLIRKMLQFKMAEIARKVGVKK